MDANLQAFLDYLKYDLKYSDNTIKSYFFDINIFLEYIESKKINYLEVKLKDIRKFIETRSKHKTYRGNYETSRTIKRRISSLTKFYDFLVSRNLISSNPFKAVITPKTKKKIPEALYENQIKALLESNALRTDEFALRDQAILMLLISTGLRCSELVNLKITDINFSNRILRVIGKGNKERIVPFSLKARDAILEYAKKSRNELLKKNDSTSLYLFLNKHGEQISSRGLEFILQNIIKKTNLELGINLHPHVLRHTFATKMLENGADIRVIQELLGHESINSTQIYTHVSKESLKKQYDLYFPKSSEKDE